MPSFSNYQIQEGVSGPILIDTIPFSAFTASATIHKTYAGVLNRAAKERTFALTNTLNQTVLSCEILPYESTAQQGTASIGGDGFSAGDLSVSTEYEFTSYSNENLKAPVDSFGLNLGMGATAPASGNLYVYVTEVL